MLFDQNLIIHLTYIINGRTDSRWTISSITSESLQRGTAADRTVMALKRLSSSPSFNGFRGEDGEGEKERRGGIGGGGGRG
jgi:hypothetical protein